MGVQHQPSPRDRPDRPRRSPSLILGALVVAVGLIVVVVNTATDPDGEAAVETTVPLAPPDSTSTTAPLQVEAAPLAELVPGLTATLYAVEGSREFQLVAWPSDRSVLTRTDLPEAWPTELEIDAAGERLALLLQDESSGNSGLYAGSVLGLRHVDMNVTSFTWHQTEPGRMMVVAARPDGETAELVALNLVDRPDRPAMTRYFDVGVYDAVLAWGEWGMLVRRYVETLDDNLIVLIDSSGAEVWAKKAHWAYATSLGDILLSFYDNEIREFRLITEETGGDEPGVWSELPSLGVTGISWSPGGDRLAVTVNQGGDQAFRLDIYDPQGGLADSISFDWRVWDVEWTPDGRFVVMPASNLPASYGVLFYDTEAEQLIPVEVDGAIRSLVTAP